MFTKENFPMYEDGLMYTGGGLTIAGIAIGLPTVLAVAAGVLIGGIGVYRIATRGRRRARSQV